MDLIRQPRQLLLPLLNNREGQHRQIHRHNAPSHALPPPLARATGSVAAMPQAEEQPDTRRVHDALLHGETLLVVAARDLEDVALEFGADAVAGDFGAHALFHEDAQFALVVDFDEFLGAIGRVGYVELHLDGGGVGVKMVVVSVCCFG